MKIDHSEYAWKVTKNRMVLREPGRPYEKSKDKDGMSKTERAKINQYKERDMYGDMTDREVWDE